MTMQRREFIAWLGTAAAWPLAARAQQSAVPVIGFLGAGSPDAFAGNAGGFRKGLNEGGFVEGKNVAIEYRWAEGRYDRLPELATELVRHPVAAILASGGEQPTWAAMAATSRIPIVFTHAGDPVASRLVGSLNRPGANVTGVNFFGNQTGTKQLGLIVELVPAAKTVALLVNPKTDILSDDVRAGARVLGLRLQLLHAATERDIDEVFTGLAQQPPDALILQTEPFLGGQYHRVAELAIQSKIPAICASRGFAAAGGLMSYGASLPDAYRQAGLYVGRILKGEKPADLPVMQSTKFDLVINLKTARVLGVTITPTLLALADEVIE